MSSEHRKGHLPQGNSTKVSNASPQNNSAYQQVSWSSDQTAATHNSAHSQYQAGSLPGLPSAKSWPNGATIPSQTKLDHDLLGLNLDPLTGEYTGYAATRYSSQSSECPCHRTVHQVNFGMESSGNGLGGLDRFLVEAPSEQGLVYFGEGILRRAYTCCCLEGL